MMLFGHMGITLTAGILARGTLVLVGKSALKVADKEREVFSESASHLNHKEDCSPGNKISSLSLLKNYIDYRLLLVGSLLPDLLDKPMGELFFYRTFQNGRIFGHTLFLNILLAALGIYVLKRRRSIWLFTLAFGSTVHLILDRMWLNPQTLLWPVYGWSFAKTSSTDFFGWLLKILHILTTEASVYVLEIIGFGILVWFIVKLIKERKVYAFVRNGIA